VSGLNKLSAIGNIGRDPETRTTAGGTELASFSLAVPNRKDDPPTWVRVTCFDKKAAVVMQYLKKGSKIYVEGPIQLREWEGNDGTKRTSLEMVANYLAFLDPKPDAGHKRGEEQDRQHQAQQANADFDDDIPF